jgi:hypothetical protein
MNYERFKKAIVSLSLMCVLVFSTIVASAVPANAQGYYYYYYPYQVQQPYYGGYWGYRRVYSDPWGGYRYYYPYGYRSRYVYDYPYGYYPYRHHYRHHYRPFRRVGRFFDWLF